MGGKCLKVLDRYFSNFDGIIEVKRISLERWPNKP
jgi:hypothetical protein